MKKKIMTGVVIVVVLCVVLIPQLLGNKQFTQAVSPPIIEAEQPAMGDIRLTTSPIGRIGPSGVVYIYPKVSGDVTAVSIKAGDIMVRGQVICIIGTKQVETAKSSMNPAGLPLKRTREGLVRQRVLYSSEGIPGQEYEQYRDNVTSAEISYNQAKYSCETQMEYSQITAPIDRLVEVCDTEPYDTVSQSNLICVISGRGSRVISFSVAGRIRGYLQEEDTIQVEKDGNSYQGTIYEISTIADEITGLYKVKVSMDGNTFLSTSSEVRLYVTSEETTNAMAIPVDAVYYEDGEPYVYVYTDGEVHRRDVENSIYDSNTMEVRSDLILDDQVVTTWSSEPYEGAGAILKNQGESERRTG